MQQQGHYWQLPVTWSPHTGGNLSTTQNTNLLTTQDTNLSTDQNKISQICSQRNFDWASGSLIIWQIGLFVKHALLLSEFGQLLNFISQVGVAIVALNWFSYILQRKQSCEYGNGCCTCGGDSKPQNLICPWSYLHSWRLVGTQNIIDLKSLLTRVSTFL